MGISIHALREEGDISFPIEWLNCTAFLSTPSARRATMDGRTKRHDPTISIHALREEGDQAIFSVPWVILQISIHALREEGDPQVIIGQIDHRHISIHALREEGDCLQSSS